MKEKAMPTERTLATKNSKERFELPSTCKTHSSVFAWMYLAMAVVSEVCGLAVMKLSVSMGRLEGLAVLYLLVALSYFFLAKAVKSISIGVAYAVWEGSGIALITLVSAVAFHQVLVLREILGLLMVVVGIWMIAFSDLFEGQTTAQCVS